MRDRVSIYLLVSIAAVAIAFGQIGCSRKPNQSQSSGEAEMQPIPEPSQSPTPGTDTASPDGSTSPVSPGSSGSSGSGGGGTAQRPSVPNTPPGAGSGRSDSDRASGSVPAPPVEERPAPPPPPRVYVLSAGSTISVWTSNDLSTKTARTGEIFTGTLAKSIVDHDWVVAKQGAPVEGVVVSSDPGGRVKGVASLTVKLKRLTLADGRKVDLMTNSFTKQAKTTHTKDAEKIVGGAGFGALIGAIAGGGKGAAIGAAVGGGAGTGVVLATRGDPAVIQGESQLNFRVNSPIRITKVER